MSSIDSPVKTIADLIVNAMPRGRALKGMKVVFRGRTFVAISEDGLIYSNNDHGRYHYPADSFSMDEVLRALCTAGRISRTELAAHMAHAKQLRAGRDLRHKADFILSDAVRLGIKLTKAQTAQLKKVLGSATAGGGR